MGLFSRLSSLFGKGKKIGEEKLNEARSKLGDFAEKMSTAGEAAIGVAGEKFNSAKESFQSGMQHGASKASDLTARGSNWLNNKVTNTVESSMQRGASKVNDLTARGGNWLNDKVTNTVESGMQRGVEKANDLTTRGGDWVNNNVTSTSNTRKKAKPIVTANSDILGDGELAQAAAEQGAPNAVA